MRPTNSHAGSTFDFAARQRQNASLLTNHCQHSCPGPPDNLTGVASQLTIRLKVACRLEGDGLATRSSVRFRLCRDGVSGVGSVRLNQLGASVPRGLTSG